MTNKLIPFLGEVVARTMPFNKIITLIHFKQNKDGTVMAKASAIDGTIHLSSDSKDQIDLEGARSSAVDGSVSPRVSTGRQATTTYRLEERPTKTTLTACVS